MAKSSNEESRSFVTLMLLTVGAIITGAVLLHFLVFAPDTPRNTPVASAAPATPHATANQAPSVAPPNPVAQPNTTVTTSPGNTPPASSAPAASLSSTASATLADSPLTSSIPEGLSTHTYKQATFVEVANERFTAVFCDRGGVLSVLRFIDDKGKTVYYRTPVDPTTPPTTPLLLLGPRLALVGWTWVMNPATGQYDRIVADKDGSDAYVFPERIARQDPAFDRFWVENDTGAFGFAGPDEWRNRVKWHADAPQVREGYTELSFRCPQTADGSVMTRRYAVYPSGKVVCNLELTVLAEAQPVEANWAVYGPLGVREDLWENPNAEVFGLFEAGGGLIFDIEEMVIKSVSHEFTSYNEERTETGRARTAAFPAAHLHEVEADRQLVMHGVSNGYFLAAIGVDRLPDWQGRAGGDLIWQQTHEASEFRLDATYHFPAQRVAPGSTHAQRVVMYAGPKDLNFVNAAFASGLPLTKSDGREMSWSEMANTGWPEFISRPITALLNWLVDSLGTVALAIIFLTIIVRLMLSPISIKAQMSMQVHGHKMRKIKPKLDEIREKYKSNKSREGQMLMFQETRAVMKAAGVSLLPLGGCLPAIMQMPIFIALYNSLRKSFVLRHESFLWIEDLSRPDALIGAWENSWYVISANGYFSINLLPLLWVVLFFIQQRMQPVPADPQQAKMQKQMSIIFVVFGLFFYAMPAGFVLYFVVSALFTMLESNVVKFILFRKGAIDNPWKREPDPAPTT